MIALWLPLLLQAAPPAATDTETWARALVDAPALTDGDSDRAVATWLEMVAREPEHPLAEAALALIGSTLDDVSDPAAARARVLELSGERMRYGAARELAWLQGRTRAAELDPDGLAAAGDLFPGFLRRAAILGPLGPLERPDAALDESARIADPGFEREHLDARGRPLRWREVERSSWRPYFPHFDQLVASTDGHAVLALQVDAARESGAWLEIDTRASGGSESLAFLATQSAPWSQYVDNPSFAFSWNGAAPVRVDLFAEARTRVLLEPVVVRQGRNVLLISASSAPSSAFAVRLLDESGKPLAGLTEPQGPSALGRAGSSAVPARALESSESFLLALPERGPDSEALLGLLLAVDGRGPEGLAHLRSALERAPDRAALAALAARATASSGYLPESWRRNRSRELFERAAALAPGRFDAELELARRLVPEDKEEEAIAELRELARTAADPTDALLELAGIYPRLDMDVQAEQAVASALQRAPLQPAALRVRAGLASAGGRAREALELSERAMESGGKDTGELESLALARAELGMVDAAEATFREVLARSDDPSLLYAFAEYYATLERFDEARELVALAARRAPASPVPWIHAADLARLAGDASGERASLRAALERAPSDANARARLIALGEPNATEAYLARETASFFEVPPPGDPARWSESVVRHVDSAVVEVFPDGATETVYRALVTANDLQACEALGTQKPAGEVLRIATLKSSDGREYEPVRSSEGYVMPSLEPGDRIDTVWRTRTGPPADGKLRLGRWSFASIDEPFEHSSYVVRIPKSLELPIVRKNFDGRIPVHETREEDGDSVILRFETRDVPRVRPEPHAPLPEWFLPSVELGVAPDRDALAAWLTSWSRLPARVTPEIAEAARAATAGIEGDLARAKALHAFVARALDKRQSHSFASATSTLLQREGNPTWLYSALLDSSGIEHDVVWSRDVSPDADPEPHPEFYGASRWLGRPLVLVKPADGPEAWCDLSLKYLPYGELLGNAPRAEAYATRAGRFIELPDVALADRPGEKARARIQVAADRSAEVELTIENTGNLGYAIKEQLREMPRANHKRIAAQIAAGTFKGIDLASYEFGGLAEDGEPLVIVLRGKVRKFLDESGGELSCRLPFPPLELSAGLAGGEGERTLPYFSGQSLCRLGKIELSLPEELELAEVPSGFERDFGGGSYVLEVQGAPGARELELRRDLLLPPLSFGPERYSEFAEFCARVDEAERVKLRFR